MAPFYYILPYIIISFCSLLTYIPVHTHAISIRMGTIEFPRSLKSIPSYEIFYEGQKIPTEIDGNKLLFTIPINRIQQRFFIIFMEKPSFSMKESGQCGQQNTVDYLMLNEGVVYRIFELKPFGNSWLCEEYLLPDKLIVPDNTIFVYIPPLYIDTLVGGNRFELPRIVIKHNILELLGGSLEELQKKADELSIEAINFNALHVPVKETVRMAGNKRIVVPTV
jgi:hypothetical protein